MSEQGLICKRTNNYATITLNRPHRRNALTHALLVQLRELLIELDQDPQVRAIILTGADRAFSAGADLQEGPSDVGEVVRTYYTPLIQQMLTMGTPLIAAVNGVAAGSGFSLTLACDFRIVSEAASFVAAFVKVALVPDAGATWLLPRIVGMTRARQIALLGAPVTAPQSLAWGLANEVVAPHDLLPRAEALADDLSSLPASVAAIRNLLTVSGGNDLTQQLEAEAVAQSRAQEHSHYGAARRAFAEKQTPRFY